MTFLFNRTKLLTGIFIFFLIYGTAVSQAPERDLYIGYSAKLFSGIDLNDAKVAIDMWSKELVIPLNDELGITIRAVSQIFKDEKHFLESPNTEKMDLITTTALDFARFHNKAWIPMFYKTSKGEFPEPLIILVNKNKTFNTLKDLHNKNIQVPNNQKLSLIELWLDNLLLAENYQTHMQFFSAFKKVSKPSNAVLNVFFGKTDACVVGSNIFKTMTELNPQLRNSLKIIQKSAPFLNTITCINAALEKGLRNLILRTAINLPYNPKGRQFLILFNGDKVVKFKESQLKSLKKLIKTNKKLTMLNKTKQ